MDIENRKEPEERVLESRAAWRYWIGPAAVAGVGLTAFGLALMVFFAERIGPGAEAWARRFEDGGLAAGDFLLAGVAGLSLAVLAAGQGRAAGRWQRIAQAFGTLTDMEIALASVRTRLSRVHLEVTVLQETSKDLLRSSEDKSATQSAGMQIDATYRLAASMDQLGERLEDRLRDQSRDLGSFLDDLNGSMRAAREQLEALAERAGERESEVIESAVQAVERVEARLPDPIDETELEIEVELEEERSDEPRVDPAQFDWGATPDADDDEEHETLSPEESGLGLLDALDDYGEPLTKDGEELPGLVPALEHSRSAPDVTGERNPLVDLLSDEILEEALQNARRRLID